MWPDANQAMLHGFNGESQKGSKIGQFYGKKWCKVVELSWNYFHPSYSKSDRISNCPLKTTTTTTTNTWNLDDHHLLAHDGWEIFRIACSFLPLQLRFEQASLCCFILRGFSNEACSNLLSRMVNRKQKPIGFMCLSDFIRAVVSSESRSSRHFYSRACKAIWALLQNRGKH